MMTKIKKSVLLVESDNALCQRIERLLLGDQWDVVCRHRAIDALEVLEESPPSHFALMICGLKFPKLQGSDFLFRAQQLTPLTQIMVALPFDDNALLIEAVNSADIHACIIVPFKDEDLISQVGLCFEKFSQLKKRELYVRLVKRQNRDLYKKSKGLKTREIKLREQLEVKKNKIVKLKLRLMKQGKSMPSGPKMLANILSTKKVALQPDTFFREFLFVQHFLNSMMEKVAVSHSLSWNPDPLHLLIPPQVSVAGESEAVTDSASIELMEKVRRSVYLAALNTQTEKLASSDLSIQYEGEEKKLEQYLEVTFSEDCTKAFVHRKKDLGSVEIPLALFQYFLKKKGVVYGIVSEDRIDAWLAEDRIGEVMYREIDPESGHGSIASEGVTKGIEKVDEENDGDDSGDLLVVAVGVAPIPGESGAVTYRFDSNYDNPGKIQEDGSIDFRERGDVPYAKKGAILAIKRPPRQGHPGMDVMGRSIPVEVYDDPAFEAGTGTVLSEDGLQILADIDGQPHVDMVGTVTVNEELVLKEDVGLATGNITFKGNVIVKGAIKDGMTVKAVNLTANEIEGATIELTGDLRVSNGLSHTTVKTVGNIHAKFINNCHIMGFGDFTVQKEIVDSTLVLSGRCHVIRGTVMASSLNCRRGIEAKGIGTMATRPSVLIVGTHSMLDLVEKEFEKTFDTVRAQLDKLKKAKNTLNGKDEALFTSISITAYHQDTAHKEIDILRHRLTEQERDGDDEALHDTREKLDALQKKIPQYESELEGLFEQQGMVAAQKEKINQGIDGLEKKNMALVQEKKSLRAYIERVEPLPEARINGTILQGTSILGPSTKLVLKKDHSKCLIREVRRDDDKGLFPQMEIISL